MPTPDLFASDPLTIPAAVYDRMWVEEVVISAPSPSGDASARIRLHRFGVVDGVATLSPDSGEWLEVNDLLAGAEEDADLAAAVSALMSYIAKVGRASGVITP